jgi:protein ImuA
MQGSKADIISRLQKDILLLQGFRQSAYDSQDAGLGLITHAFPNAIFPTAAIHEFFCSSSENSSASSGFISAIMASLMKKTGYAVWISSSQSIFPPALQSFGINAERILFLHIKKEKEKLWAMEEVLKCDSIASVVGEINEISFTESRRLQLAVEKSRVTGFVLRLNPKNFSTACIARWKIESLPGQQTELPGLGFPAWNVSLLKIRNGKPGCWQMEWKNNRFRFFHQPVIITTGEQRKTG